MNVLVTLAFDGTNYHGFQVQKNGQSICQAFQDGLEKVFGIRSDVKGCSRTDSGVHALGFRLNFHIQTKIPLEKIPLALNQVLPPDIRVIKAEQVAEEFHARYSAHSKEYLYRIRNSNIDSPFDKPYYWRCTYPLNIEKMQQAAQLLVGTHDFAAFMSAGSKIINTVRTIYRFDVTKEEDMLYCTVNANGYLYNMVRIMCGTLVEIGMGKLPIEQIRTALQSKQRKDAGITLPPQGLFLNQVYYLPESEDTKWQREP